jgi:hypothetical protein
MKIYKPIVFLFVLFAMMSVLSTQGWGNKSEEDKSAQSLFVKIKPETVSPKEEKEHFKEAVSKRLAQLAKDFDNQDLLKEAGTGAGLTAERVLISLASLLMEQTTCAAVYLDSNSKLFIGYNKSSASRKKIPLILSSLRKLLKKDKDILPLHRADLMKDEDARKILGLSSNRGRDTGKIDQEISKSADAMVHWLKKVLKLRDHMTAKSELGNLARCLMDDDKINYFKTLEGHHAEMNILDALHKNGRLDKGGFVGISKKCCLKCAAALQAVNLKSPKNKYLANGCHFKVYEWPVPNFLKEDEGILKEFMGSDAFNIFSKQQKEYQKALLDEIASLTKDTIKEKTKRVTAIEATETESATKLEVASDEKALSIVNGKHSTKTKVSKRKSKSS